MAYSDFFPSKLNLRKDLESLTYDYIKLAGPITITEDGPLDDTGTWQTISTLDLNGLGRTAGTYEIKLSMTWTYNQTSSSARFRWSIDNGVNWSYFQEEPKDSTNMNPKYYGYPIVYVSNLTTADNIIVEMRKENAGAIMIIDFLDIILERKI